MEVLVCAVKASKMGRGTKEVPRNEETATDLPLERRL